MIVVEVGQSENHCCHCRGVLREVKTETKADTNTTLSVTARPKSTRVAFPQRLNLAVTAVLCCHRLGVTDCDV
jgi:hypothetical protein